MVDTPSLRLPAGMRDFAPLAAAARRRIAETLLGVFESWGFARVITPAFEYEEVLGLGLGKNGRAAALKFVEPSSGRVVALRPDITPQIARLIATRFRDETGPVRLCYEGTVLRLDKGARSQRELIQAGVELAGVTAPEGDAEVIALGAEALVAAGLNAETFDLTIDLGHLGLMREVFAGLNLSDSASAAMRGAIAKRDRTAVDAVLGASRISTTSSNAAYDGVARFVRALPDFSGGAGVLKTAASQAPNARIRRAISDLQEIVKSVESRHIPARLHIDLGEVRGFDYYTGVRFQAFVSGAAEPVLQGGRYDDLLGRYGRANPAVGFAIDVEAAAGALEVAQGAPGDDANDRADAPVLVIGATAQAVVTARDLRAKGRRAAPLLVPMSDAEIAAYAARWGYREIKRVGEPAEKGPRAREVRVQKKGQRKN
ncbi:MAG: ATP phosphoribosyltransferase regulatory subunit [Deltaproteobacteria bacterium]|nr:ATP phosphoribosyltransferase regulatory subunit [Deltaproteobacteria bacterium]